jgi:hypothetical protein
MEEQDITQNLYETCALLSGCIGDMHKIADRIARRVGGREVSLAITNAQQANMWLKQAAAEIDAVNNPTTGTSNTEVGDFDLSMLNKPLINQE